MLNVRRRSLPEKSDAWLDVEGSRTAKLKCSTADYEVIVLKQVIGLSVLCLVRVYLTVSLSLCLRLAMSLRFISVSLCMSLCMSLCLCLFLRSLATPKTRTLFLVNSKTSCVDGYHNIIVIVNSRIRQRYSLNASEVHQLIQYSRALLIFPEELPVVVKKRVDIAFRIVVGEVLAQIIVRAKFSTCAPTQMNNEYTDRTLRLRRRGRGLATLYAVHLTYTVPANKTT